MPASSNQGIAAAWLAPALLLGLRAFAAPPDAPVLHVDANGAIADIRSAATEARQAGGPHPLPLASSWATGVHPGGFDPSYQLAQIAQGHRLLPWIQVPDDAETVPAAYYEPVTQQLARLHLPLTLVSTQWDVAVARGTRGDAHVALSPFSPLDAWYAAGRHWSRNPVIVRMQALYPDPPRLILLSNNEQKKLGWREVRALGLLPAGLSDEEVRRRVGDAWIERYRELIRGFRDGLAAPEWRRNSRFVGYDAFGSVAFARWDGWLDYSLYVPGRFEPWPMAWEGASVSYYTDDWNPSTDFTVYSPGVGAGSLVPMLEQSERLRGDEYWFELSFWDGQTGDAKGKDAYYRSLGQTYDPARYQGYVQLGLWLTRPRVAREFRGPLQSRAQYGPYFDALAAAVDRVHDDPLLRLFWRHGRLLANQEAAPPYQAAVPAEWRNLPRWYLLDSASNPPRPWSLETSLEVFALALELGSAPNREWLVYATSPLATDVRRTPVRIPGGPTVSVETARQGCFTHVAESGGRTVLDGCRT
jgi:hypothetical protein